MLPIDMSKFRKEITKSIPHISVGFHDPMIFLDTGCYALNYRIASRFDGGVPLEGKLTMFAGASGAGKSYIASANIVKDAQAKGIYVVLLDSENALDEEWLEKLGVDTSEDKLMRISVILIDDVAKIITEFMKSYKSKYENLPREERPPVLFVLDSVGQLLTPTESEQFSKGDMKGDMGRKPKQLASMCRNVTGLMGAERIGMIITNHTYDSQDMYNPDSKISGGRGLVYASSIIVDMEQKKLKEDDEGNKTTSVNGIRSVIQVRKSRYAKPHEKLEVLIPWETGMDKYSGLFDLFENMNVIVRENQQFYTYTSKVTGEVFRGRKRDFGPEIFDKIMSEWTENEEPLGVGLDLEGNIDDLEEDEE